MPSTRSPQIFLSCFPAFIWLCAAVDMLVWVDNYAYSDLFSGHTLTHVYACSRKFFNGSSARFSLAQTERTLKDFGRMKKFCSDSSRMRDCFVVPLLVIFSLFIAIPIYYCSAYVYLEKQILHIFMYQGYIHTALPAYVITIYAALLSFVTAIYGSSKVLI